MAVPSALCATRFQLYNNILIPYLLIIILYYPSDHKKKLFKENTKVLSMGGHLLFRFQGQYFVTLKLNVGMNE